MTNQALKDDPYFVLEQILRMAYDQSKYGKGKARHAKDGEPFENQVICEVGRRVGLGYNLGQAVKKIYESCRLPPAAAQKELLGAINYVASAVQLLFERDGILCSEDDATPPSDAEFPYDLPAIGEVLGEK